MINKYATMSHEQRETTAYDRAVQALTHCKIRLDAISEGVEDDHNIKLALERVEEARQACEQSAQKHGEFA